MSIQSHVNKLKQKHQQLKEVLKSYAANFRNDSIRITELKKQKLLLKEKIYHLETSE